MADQIYAFRVEFQNIARMASRMAQDGWEGFEKGVQLLCSTYPDEIGYEGARALILGEIDPEEFEAAMIEQFGRKQRAQFYADKAIF